MQAAASTTLCQRGKYLAVVIALLGALSLAGCQTSSGRDDVSLSVYTPLFDQGSHFRQLLNQDEFDKALSLFEEQRAFFSNPEQRRAFAAELRILADHFNNPYAADAKAALADIGMAEWPAAPTEWPRIRGALEKTNTVPLKHPSEILYSDTEIGLAPLREAKERYEVLSTKIRDDIQSEFDKYDHFTQESFFLKYPSGLVPDKKAEHLNATSLSFLRAEAPDLSYASLAEKIRNAELDRLEAFARRYPNSDFLPENVKAAFFNATIQRNAAEFVSKGLPEAAAHFQAAAHARTQGYVKFLAISPHVDVTRLPESATQNAADNQYPVDLKIDLSRVPEDHSGGAKPPAHRFVAFVGQPVAGATLETVKNDTVSSLRPIKTERRENPDWLVAKSEAEEAKKRYEDAGGDEEMFKPQDKNTYHHTPVCTGSILGCAVGYAIGGMIVGAVATHRKNKREEILNLNAEKNLAEAKFLEIPKELVKHTYGPYDFSRQTIESARETRLRVLVADREKKSYAVLQYRLNQSNKEVVIDDIDALDKDRDKHLKSAVTRDVFERRNRQALSITLSELIATSTWSVPQRGRFSSLDELKILAERQLIGDPKKN